MAQTAEEFLGLESDVDKYPVPGYSVTPVPQVVLGDPADVPGLTQAGRVDISMRPVDEQYITRKTADGIRLTLPGEESSDFGTFADEQSARTYGRRLERWNNLSRAGGLISKDPHISQNFAPGQFASQVDLLEPGNIDLDKRTPVKTRAGIVDTEDPTVVTFTDKKDPEYGKSILIPKVIDGKPLTESYAKRYYEKTGEHLGKFKNELAAREYSKKLRERQVEVYGIREEGPDILLKEIFEKDPDNIPTQRREENKPLSLAPTGPKATPVTFYSNGGVDENSDVWTEKGYTSTGKNLVPGVAAVNPDKYPLGTVLKDADSGDVFVAADKHSNKDPNVVDLYVSPEKYERISGTRNLEVIGKETVPKDAKGMQELLAKYKAPNTPQIPLAGDGTSIPIINAIDKDAPYMSRPRPANSIKRIVVHGDVNEDAEKLLEYGRHVDPKRGFDPGYHFYVARDGRILQGAPIERITNHIKGKNADSLGIVVAGADEGKQPTRQQEIATKALISRLGKDLGIAANNVVGHGEVQANRDKREGGNIASDIRKNGYLEKSDVPLDGLVSMPPKMKDYGMVQEGNIDLNNRKGVVNPDGTVSTVLSMSFEDSDGKETLIPRVVNGRVVPPEDAIAHYRETGQHLGKFNTVAAADAFAQQLHLSEEKRVAQNIRGTENRKRLTDAIAESEKAGYKVPHAIGTEAEPEGDRAPQADMENLVDALHRQSANLRMKGKMGAAEKVHDKIAYWNDQIRANASPAEKQTLHDELVGKLEKETNRLRTKLQEEGIQPIPKGEPTGLFGRQIREPYEGENKFFKENPNVGGMAAEDGSIVLNPYSPKGVNKAAVARNEAFRLQLGKQIPDFEVTKEQIDAFRNTPYRQESLLKQTIAARIYSGDPSAGNVTAEQKKWVKNFVASQERAAQPKEKMSAEEFLGLTIPVANTKLADTLGYKQWIDSFTGFQVRKAEKFQKAEDFIEGVKPVTPAQSWWKNAINSLGRGATSEGGLMTAEGAYAMAEYLTKGTKAEKVFAPSAEQREKAGKMRDTVRDYLHVDEEFANSLTGQILQGIGQLAMLPAYAVPGFGPAVTATQLFQEAKDDYKATMKKQGKTVDEDAANAAAMKYMLGAALPEYVMDKLIIGKFFKGLKGKKITLGELGKTFGILAATGGATETAQQAWLNVIAKEIDKYDPDRKLTQELWESFVVGAVVEGGAGAAAQATGGVIAKLKEEKPGKDTRSAEERQAEVEARRAKKPEPPAGMPGGPISVGPKPAPAPAPAPMGGTPPGPLKPAHGAWAEIEARFNKLSKENQERIGKLPLDEWEAAIAEVETKSKPAPAPAPAATAEDLKSPKIKRINTGLYQVTIASRVFEIEDLSQASETGATTPDWQLYEITSGNREWWNGFATKKDALNAIVRGISKSQPTETAEDQAAPVQLPPNIDEALTEADKRAKAGDAMGARNALNRVDFFNEDTKPPENWDGTAEEWKEQRAGNAAINKEINRRRKNVEMQLPSTEEGPGQPAVPKGPAPAPAPAARTKQDVWADLARAEQSGDKEAQSRLLVELDNVPLGEVGEVEEPGAVQHGEFPQAGYTATSQPSISTTETEEESRYGPSGRGAFEHAASQVNRKFPGIPKIEVVDTFDQVRSRFPAGNEDLANEPVIYDQDLGRIVMIRDNMQDVPAETLQEYIARLALSQAAPVGGLHNMLEGRPEGAAYQQALLRAFPNLSVADFGTAWGDQFGYSNLVELAAMREKDLSDPRQAAQLIEEHASNVAGQPTHPEWFEQLTSDVQAILGTMGLNLNPFEASTLIQKSVPASEEHKAEQETRKDAANAAINSPYVTEDFSTGELRQHYPEVTLAHLPEIRIVEMPELIKLAKAFMGNLPILKKLRKAFGQAHGKDSGYIYLHPDIFKDYVVASKVIAHELGHIIDFIASGNKKFRGLKGLATKFPKMNATIRQQLIDLTHWWKPWDENTAPASYTAYRKSGVELWADAMSVFFNSPAELRKRAPMFWHAWMEFLDGHQDIKDQIMELQSLLHRPHMEVLSLRSKDRRQGFTDTGELWIAAKRKQRTIKETLGGWVQDLKDQLYYQYQDPAVRRQAALEKAGVKIDPELDMRRLFDEHPLADNLIYTWLGRIKNEVIDKLAEHDLTQEDLGEYLMLNRVMVGAYHEKAAPGGENPWTARQGLYRLRSQIGLDRWQILERYADRFHDYVYDIMKEAYMAGMIGKDEFVNVITPNRGTYAAFRPISYVEKRVGAGLYSITGFLETAENPFFTTILKMIAFRRGIQWHRTKSASVDFLKTYYPSDIKKAKLDKHGKPLRVENPRERGIISVREDGKWKNYEVPADYARMFDPPALPSVVNGVIRALHWTFRSGFYQTFVKFNPAFQLIRSPIRDFGRLYTNMPSGVSARKLASEYLKAIPVAARRLKGEIDPIVMEMYENFAFSTPHDTFARNMQKHDPLEMILQEYHILPESKKAAWRNNFLIKIIEWLGDKIVFAGQVLEAAPKIAAYKINTRDLGWRPEKGAAFIRNYIGVPNYLKKGSHAFAAGAVMPFWNVALQGLVADAKLLSGHEETVSAPRAAGKKIAVRAATWWLKFAMATGVFAILQALAKHGLFGDDLKELYAGISDYTHTNYTVIPLGQTEGGDFGHKTLFLQIPQDEVSRMIGGLLKKTIDMAAERINDDPHDPFFNELAQLFGFAGGQLPGYHPIPVIAGRWNEYMRGHNPYDTFRGQHILTRDQYLAGGWESLKPMLGMTFNETGLTNFFRFNPDYDSTTEALVTHIPILQSVLKVSDFGNLEKQQRDINDPKAAAAQLRLGALPDNVYKVLKQYNSLRSLGKHKTEYQTQRYDQLKVWYKTIYKPTFESAKRELDMGGDPRPIMDTIEGATEEWE